MGTKAPKSASRTPRLKLEWVEWWWWRWWSGGGGVLEVAILSGDLFVSSIVFFFFLSGEWSEPQLWGLYITLFFHLLRKIVSREGR